MVKVGLIVFANNGGLGAQTRRLAKLINPYRVMIIDSTNFSPNKQQHLDWYKDYQSYVASSFPPSEDDIDKFLQNLTHIVVVENVYNHNLTWKAQQKGIKVIVQPNYEFFENVEKLYLPVPDKIVMPSYWKMPEMIKRFGDTRVQYLPPPIDPSELENARSVNEARPSKNKKPRFLHVIGTPAMHDRNGTLDLLDAVKLTKSDFELVIKTQHQISMSAFLDDPRVTYELNDVEDIQDLYTNYDAVLFPRRWGGLTLVMNEALMAGLPVIMTKVEPNISILPDQWTVPAKFEGTFKAQSARVEYCSVDHQGLADRIDWLVEQDFSLMKAKAFEIAVEEYSIQALLPKYLELFNDR